MVAFRYYICCLLSFCGGIATGQTYEEPPVMEVKLPDRVPPSPQAAAITRYGGIDVNESSGTVNKTIPLHTYTAGKLSLPILLSYSGAGVKVDQIAEWTGVNWTLNAGGVITRTVNDLADESNPSKRRVYDYQSFVPYTLEVANGTSNGEFFSEIQRDPDIDSEPDIFSFSFAGYSGTFILDAAFNAVYQKQDSNLLIELIGEQQSAPDNLRVDKKIRITTPDGVKYYFGGEWVESTSVKTIVNGSQTGPETLQGTTAFYLYRIEHPFSGVIQLVYERHLGDKLYTQSKIRSKNRIMRICGYNCSEGTNHEGANGTPVDISENPVLMTQTLRVTGACYLKKITGGDFEVLFDHSPVASFHPNRKLDQITVKNNNLTWKKITLSYIVDAFASNDSRHFLSKIEFDEGFPGNTNTQDGRRNEVYEFEYESPLSLPSRFSSQQDMVGYYNGKPNPSNSLPYSYVWSPYSTVGFADRLPDFDFAKRGTLKKVYYPTGGYTLIEYEAKPAKRNVEQLYSVSAFRHRNESPSSLLQNTWPPITAEDGAVPPPTVPFNQTVTFYFNATCDRPGTFNAEHDAVTMQVVDVTDMYAPVVVLTDTISFSEPTLMTTPLPLVVNRGLELDLVEGRKYRVNISINEGLQNPMEASVSFRYVTGYQEVSGYGVRIKRQSDFVSNAATEPANVTRYYYRPIDDLFPPIDDLPYVEANPTISRSMHVKGLMNTNGSAFIPMRTYYKTLSSANVPDDAVDIRGNFATVSISHGGDLFENGGVEKTFLMKTDFEGSTYLPITPPLPNQNPEQTLYVESDSNQLITVPNPAFTSVMRGMLVNEKTYASRNGVLYKQLEKRYAYQYNEQPSVYSLIVSKLYDFGTVTLTNRVTNLNIQVMKAIAFRPALDTLTTRTFVDPVPIGAPDESIYRSIVQRETFKYESFPGQLTSHMFPTSSGEAVETRYYYVDKGRENTLPGGDLSFNPSENNARVNAFTTLLNYNIVKTPVQVESWLNGKLLSRTRTVYKDFPTEVGVGDPQIDVFPEYILYAKGNETLEDRIQFENYDEAGNPILVRNVGGPSIFYNYNSRNQVTRKIENYTGNTAPEIPVDYDANNLPDINTVCAVHVSNSSSMVTDFFYDHFGNLLMIVDPRCEKTTFEYDSRHKLIRRRNHQGHILEEYDYNYKRY